MGADAGNVKHAEQVLAFTCIFVEWRATPCTSDVLCAAYPRRTLQRLLWVYA